VCEQAQRRDLQEAYLLLNTEVLLLLGQFVGGDALPTQLLQGCMPRRTSARPHHEDEEAVLSQRTEGSAFSCCTTVNRVESRDAQGATLALL
jgi:hypothetical protein